MTAGDVAGGLGALDPIRVLTVKLARLGSVRTANEAAATVACALQNALGARAVVIHAVDARRDELRVIGANGGVSVDLLGRRVALSKDVVATSFGDHDSAVTIVLDAPGRRIPERARIVGATRSLLAMRVFIGDRCVAVIEVVDSDESYLRRRHIACAYAAERLAMAFSVVAARRRRPAIEHECRWFEDANDPWVD